MQVSAKRPASENGLADLRAVRPDSNLGAHQAGEDAAASEGAATRAGERNLREKLSFGDADLGIRGDQVLLGLANIRATLEQSGGHARRNFRRKCLLLKLASARHTLRVITEKNT